MVQAAVKQSRLTASSRKLLRREFDTLCGSSFSSSDWISSPLHWGPSPPPHFPSDPVTNQSGSRITSLWWIDLHPPLPTPRPLGWTNVSEGRRSVAMLLGWTQLSAWIHPYSDPPLMVRQQAPQGTPMALLGPVLFHYRFLKPVGRFNLRIAKCPFSVSLKSGKRKKKCSHRPTRGGRWSMKLMQLSLLRVCKNF